MPETSPAHNPRSFLWGAVLLCLLVPLAAGTAVLSLRFFMGDLFFINGRAANELDRTDASVWSFERAASWDPNNYKTLIELGNAYERSDNYEPAIAAYERVLTLAPNHVETHIRFAALESITGEFDRASTRLESARGLVPTYWRTERAVGLLEGRRGNHTAAASRLLRADRLTVFPEAGVLSQLAVAFHKSGNQRQALPYAKRAVRADPGNPANHLLLAKLEIATGQPGAAERSLESAIAAGTARRQWTGSGESAETWRLLSRVRLQNGDLTGAAEALATAAAAADSAPARDIAVRLEAELARGSAAEDLSQADRGAIETHLALTYLAFGKYDFAINWLERACARLDGESRDHALAHLARAYLLRGRPAEALAVAETAYRLDRNPQLRLARADALVELGRDAEARAEYLALRAVLDAGHALQPELDRRLDALNP